MRISALSLCLILLGTSLANAQEKLTELSAPTSPASSLLDVQPQSVLSPKSYRALETALYSNFLNSSGEGVIPSDFALEFTPYWTNDHSLSIEDYLYPKDIWKDQVMRNSSFSIASTQNYLLGDSTATSALAFGYRTTLYFGNKKDREQVEKQIQQISKNQIFQSRIGSQVESFPYTREEITNKEEFIEAAAEVLFNAIQETYPSYSAADVQQLVEMVLRESSSLPPYDPNEPDPFLNAFMHLIETKLAGIKSELNAQRLFQELKSYIKNRQGFSVDIAYGFVNFPGSNFKSAVAPRQAVWITPSYRFKEAWRKLQITAVFRYEGYDTGYYKTNFPGSEVFENNLDYGLAVSGEFDRFSIQFEAVGRSSNSVIPAGMDNQGNELFRKDSRSDFQAIGTFVYRLNDQLALTYSLGDSFEPIFNSDNTLVSLLSLNFGFGSPTREALDL